MFGTSGEDGGFQAYARILEVGAHTCRIRGKGRAVNTGCACEALTAFGGERRGE